MNGYFKTDNTRYTVYNCPCEMLMGIWIKTIQHMHKDMYVTQFDDVSNFNKIVNNRPHKTGPCLMNKIFLIQPII